MRHAWMVVLLAGVSLCGSCASGPADGLPDAGLSDGSQDAGSQDGGPLDGAGDSQPEPSWKVCADWPTGEARDIAAAGSRLFTANMYGLQVYDRSDPASPALLGRYPTPGEAWRVAVDGDRAALADGRHGIAILDVSDPSAIEIIASLPLDGEARGVTLSGDLLVACSSRAAPRLFDLSEPASPVALGELPGYTAEAAFWGQRVLTFGPLRSPDDPPEVCTLDTRQVLRVMDVSDPSAPVELGSIQFGSVGHDPACEGHAVVMPQDGWGLVVHGQYLYLVETESRVRILDLSVPSEPQEIGRVSMPVSWVRGLVIEAGRLLASTEDGVLEFDIGDPLDPVLTETIQIPAGRFIQSLDVMGGRVAALSAGKLHELHLLDAADLNLLGVVNIGHPYIGQVAQDASHAYVAAHPGLTVVDLDDPAGPRIEAMREDLGEMRTIALAGSLALLAGQDRILTVDLSTPARPALMGTLELGSLDARSAAVQGELGLVVSGSTAISLRVIDLADPARPALAGQIDLPGKASEPRVALSEGIAYAACGTEGLAVIDVQTPSAPERVGSYVPWTAEGVYEVAVSGDLAFAAAGPFVHVLDVSEPSQPSLVADVDTPGYATRIAAEGERAVVGDTYDLVQISLVR
ncbi:MAG: hypothetical protein JXR96_00790 [Deltaproteobacteria bacterium]|nr:hypothetical protein [Deltaproteobacteria bacterium]